MMAQREAVGNKTIRLFCVDDHAFLIEGLRSRFEREQGLEFLGSLPSAQGLLEAIQRDNPDVVLLDIDMPGPDPFEIAESIKAQAPRCHVVFLSAFVRHSYLDAAMKAGAWGYVSKRDAPSEIIGVIRQAAAGKFALSPEVITHCGLDPARPMADPARPESKLNSLTPRELQILRMIGRGMPRNEIADAIHRSPKTVDAHRSAIMDKLGLHDRVELARFAIAEGLVEL